jgi:hypothetical protein
VLICAGLIASTISKRRAKKAYGVPTNPAWLDAVLVLIPIAIVLAFVAVMNAYRIPSKAEAQGIPIPVLIWGAVALLISFLVHRTRFGRYIFAMGGNPDAAALVGIPVRRVTMLLFLLLAVLTTIAAIVAISRLNAGTNSLGNNLELLVIAATVIGGTALAGGSGTIIGSVLGALIMQCDRQRHAAARHLDRHALRDHRPGAHRWPWCSTWPIASGPETQHERAGGPEPLPGRAAQHPQGLWRRACGRRCQPEPLSGRSGGRAGPQRRRQVHADEDAGRCLPDRQRRGPDQRRAGACPHAVRRTACLGIESIYQTLALADNLDSVANLFLGRELLTRWRTLDDHRMDAEARKVFQRLNKNFTNVRIPVRRLSGGQRQVVAISRAIYFNAKILIMDEPTAAWGRKKPPWWAI